jgi:hypothetical protein
MFAGLKRRVYARGGKSFGGNYGGGILGIPFAVLKAIEDSAVMR